MKTKIFYIAAGLIIGAATLQAQSTPAQTKAKSTEKRGAGQAGKQPDGSGSSSATSEATTGTPPTHIDKTNSVPAASNPQNTGVNAINKKKSGSTVQGGPKKEINSSDKRSEGKKKQR